MRRVLIPGAVGLVVILSAAVLAARLIGSHQAPPALALGSPQATGSASNLDGKWTVGAGSQVGYRAKEKFINQASETEAVARTSSVSGSFIATVAGGSVKVSQMKFTVDLATLTSQDKYANYQVYQRDFFVRSIYLQTGSFPMATFTADPMSFPVPAGGTLTIDVSGKLTVHGTTKVETAHLEAVAGSAGQAEIAGSMSVDMRDFGIDPPDISFTHAEPQVTIEFDLKLVRAVGA